MWPDPVLPPDHSSPWMAFGLEILLAVAVVVFFLVIIFKRNYVLVIRIANGEPRVVRGRAPRGFLEELREICKGDEISTGVVRGWKSGRRIRLTFSRQLAPASCQRIRNTWNVYLLKD